MYTRAGRPASRLDIITVLDSQELKGFLNHPRLELRPLRAGVDGARILGILFPVQQVQNSGSPQLTPEGGRRQMQEL